MSVTNSRSQHNHTKQEILIVDDVPQVRHDLRQLLELTGLFEIVAEAADPQEAVRQAMLQAPDAVLVDLQMPHQDGYEAMRLIKTNHLSPRVIALSADASCEEIERARVAGADGFVMKGERYEVLVNTLLGIDNPPTSFKPKEGE